MNEDALLEALQKASEPLSLAAIAKQAGAARGEQKNLSAALAALEEKGRVVRNRRGAYGLPERMGLVQGVVRGHRSGGGTLLTESGQEWFLPPREMRRVFNRDEVLVNVQQAGRRGSPEAGIVKVLQRNTQHLVGRYRVDQGTGFVKPDDPANRHLEVIVKPADAGSASSGDMVAIAISRQPDDESPPAGCVEEVLGDNLNREQAVHISALNYDIPAAWPPAALQEAEQYPDMPTAEDMTARADLRDLDLLTIDGEDARDFDDAVYCEGKPDGGWRLWVAIADVSHYVPPGSALDQEAALRGNSVYFPEHVIPMLPEALSNGLCSLNPEVERLCVACEMNISSEGKLGSFRFCEGVMRSQARLTYTEVAALLGMNGNHADAKTRRRRSALLKPLQQLQRLFKVLLRARQKRGAIDFEMPEHRVLFDEEGAVQSVAALVRNDAHRLIEECMLCANVAAARFLQKHRLSILYRVHERPSEEGLEELRQLLAGFDLNLQGGGQPSPAHFQRLLRQVQGLPEATAVQMMVLRVMSRAVYQPENHGHFGLHYPAYAHFTSPIRRYPDLLVHRAIRHIIRSERSSPHVRRIPGAGALPKKAIFPYRPAEMEPIGIHCSMTERRADDATRDATKRLVCEWLRDSVGEVFDGVVTGITSFGMFVELGGVAIDGLLHISSLENDYYHFDPARLRLTGQRTKEEYRLGQSLRVQIAEVNADLRRIGLQLENQAPRRSRRGRWQRRR